MIKIYDCEQVAEKLKRFGIHVSGRTILRWLALGKIEATLLHETQKTKVRYFTDSDIQKIAKNQSGIKAQKKEKEEEFSLDGII